MDKFKDLHIMHNNNVPQDTGKKWLIIITIIAFVLSIVVMFGNNIIHFFSGTKISEEPKEDKQHIVHNALNVHTVIDDIADLDIL